MIVASLAVIPLAPMGPLYTVVALGSGAWFMWECITFLKRAKQGLSGTQLKAMRVFHGSITYLSILFLAVAIDPFLNPFLG